MIQLIGWLLCVYLVVKGFELIAMKEPVAYAGAVIAFIAAVFFFWAFAVQAPVTPVMPEAATDELQQEIDQALRESNEKLAE